MKNKSLFNHGEFKSHSGNQLDWKIDCDSLSHEDLECLTRLVGQKLVFDVTIPIPRGGIKFARLLNDYTSLDVGIERCLIVDDVLSTGGSMEELRTELLGEGIKSEDITGVVIFARTKPADWIHPIFQLSNTFHD